MTVDNINVEESIKNVVDLLAQEKDLSPALKASIEVLILLISILVNRLGLNSRNSSKPPSSDPNRAKKPLSENKRKPGGQKGHTGTTLKRIETPDIIERIELDRSRLPQGKYQLVGYESRQIIDLDIRTFVTEYQAEILEDQNGKRYIAPFPEGVTRPVQYGAGVKSWAVYMSQYQMIPYNRIEEQFLNQMQMSVSAGSVVNFNQDAYARLEDFDHWVKAQLSGSALIHLDETGINIGGVRSWLHNTSNGQFSYFYPHEKRGGAALDDIGILKNYMGITCHDHWKPYFNYGKTHALCNAHHLRELTRAFQQDKQEWANHMHELLVEINSAVKGAGGCLDPPASAAYRKRYQKILEKAESECPPPKKIPGQKKRGRIARSKSRNLLERLRDFEDATLRFMDNPIVPFTNNQAENDLRMIKVQQKVSGCFRSMEGAKTFCRIRSYLTTCRKQNLSATEALRLLFQGKRPAFMEPTTNQACAE